MSAAYLERATNLLTPDVLHAHCSNLWVRLAIEGVGWIIDLNWATAR